MNVPPGCVAVHARGLLAILVVLMSQPAGAASFDCTEATSKQEKLVCSVEELDRLDAEMAIQYTRVLTTSADSERVRKDHRRWLTHERAACKDNVTCLKEAYLQRIAALTKLAALRLEVLDDGKGGLTFTWRGEDDATTQWTVPLADLLLGHPTCEECLKNPQAFAYECAFECAYGAQVIGVSGTIAYVEVRRSISSNGDIDVFELDLLARSIKRVLSDVGSGVGAILPSPSGRFIAYSRGAHAGRCADSSVLRVYDRIGERLIDIPEAAEESAGLDQEPLEWRTESTLIIDERRVTCDSNGSESETKRQRKLHIAGGRESANRVLATPRPVLSRDKAAPADGESVLK